MRAIMAERSPPDDLDDDGSKEYKPFTKDDVGVNDLPVSNVKGHKYKIYTLEQTMALIAMGNATTVEPPQKVSKSYPTYSREQVEAWVQEYFTDKEKMSEFLRQRTDQVKKPNH